MPFECKKSESYMSAIVTYSCIFVVFFSKNLTEKSFYFIYKNMI